MSLKERLMTRRGPVEREIPELGKVWIRRLSCNEMLALSDEKDTKQGLRRIVADCLVDEAGNRVLQPNEVGAADWPTVKAISDAALEVNKLDLKAAEKNSTTPPSST